MSSQISILVATDLNGAIGRDGKLAWSVPSDLRRFKARTIGGTVIMGRRTWESLPQAPLPNRQNIVVSSTVDRLEGAWVSKTLDAAISKASVQSKNVWIIGGAQLYQAAIINPLVTQIIATELDWIEVDAPDAWFPQIDPQFWGVGGQQYYSYPGEDPYYETVYRRHPPALSNMMRARPRRENWHQ